MSLASAADLARATFRRLAVLRLAPTPENYARVYREVEAAGGTEPAATAAVAPTPPAAPAPAAPVAPVAAPRGAGAAEPAPWRLLWGDSLRRLLTLCDGGEAPPELAPLLAAADNLAMPADVRELVQRNQQLWQRCRARLQAEQGDVDAALALAAAVLDGLCASSAPESWEALQWAGLRDVLRRPLQAQRIVEARGALQTLFQQQAALGRSAEQTRLTARQLAAKLVRDLGEYMRHGHAFNQTLDADLELLQQTQDPHAVGELLTALLEQGRDLQRHGTRLAEQLEQAQHSATQAHENIRRLERELEQASQQLQEDPLTGALNRRGLDVAFARDAGSCRAAGRPLSVALLDLDHFKSINDSFGHDFGDEVLRGLVFVARKLLRPGDTVARMGGEEFMLVLPQTDAASAQGVLERLLQGFRNRRVLHHGTGQRMEVTFSAGIAQLGDDEDFAALYQRADGALLRAKHAGRQRIEAAVVVAAVCD